MTRGRYLTHDKIHDPCVRSSIIRLLVYLLYTLRYSFCIYVLTYNMVSLRMYVYRHRSSTESSFPRFSTTSWVSFGGLDMIFWLDFPSTSTTTVVTGNVVWRKLCPFPTKTRSVVPSNPEDDCECNRFPHGYKSDEQCVDGRFSFGR